MGNIRQNLIEGQIPKLQELVQTALNDGMDAEVNRCVDTAGQTNPLMLGPGCSIPYTAPLEKIKIFLEAAHMYGSYDYINCGRWHGVENNGVVAEILKPNWTGD